MAATFIPGLVIKHNNDVYLTPDLEVGVMQAIPTPGNGANLDGDYYAVPISNYGIVTGFNFVPTTSDDVNPPTPQSFHVFRLVSGSPLRVGNDVWYVRGTSSLSGGSPAAAGYIQAAADAECCDATPATLPTDVPVMKPCQIACEQNADGNYFFVLGLPTDQGTYTARGYLNGETLTNATGATAAALQTSLNTNWTNQGSPQIAITWTITNGIVMGIITAGNGEDVLCAGITTA